MLTQTEPAAGESRSTAGEVEGRIRFALKPNEATCRRHLGMPCSEVHTQPQILTHISTVNTVIQAKAPCPWPSLAGWGGGVRACGWAAS